MVKIFIRFCNLKLVVRVEPAAVLAAAEVALAQAVAVAVGAAAAGKKIR